VTVRAAFVYANPRAALARDVRAGIAPDTGLLGQNHLGSLGVEASIHDPWLTRRERRGVAHRLTWHLRELALPLELGGVDVVCTPLANLLPLTIRLRRVRTVVLNYGLNLIVLRASAARRRLLRASLRSAARVVCLGDSQREQLLELTGLPERHVQSALFGVDERFFASMPAPAAGYVLSVGRDLARDYGTFVRAVDGLDVRVVVVAEQRNFEGVRLPTNVETKRGLTYAELRDLYAGSACVVIPMRPDGYRYGSEASGLTAFLEAAASGRAVVATDRAVLRDYLEPEATGLVVPAEEPEALRAALERALGDRELAGRLGAEARKSVEDGFTTRHLAERLAPFLLEAARR
jgi:glycosyltransferase involved in cell wall biosynthesis